MCLAVIANQFSLTKERENKKMMEEITSNSGFEVKQIIRQINSWADLVNYLQGLFCMLWKRTKNKTVCSFFYTTTSLFYLLNELFLHKKRLLSMIRKQSTKISSILKTLL
jgi:hypothetical protein